MDKHKIINNFFDAISKSNIVRKIHKLPILLASLDDVDVDIINLIIECIVPDHLPTKQSEKLQEFIIQYINHIIDDYDQTISEDEISEYFIENFEDINPSDVPDKQLDRDFLDLLGVENPDE